MNDLLGTIFCWFQSLWCDNLDYYLWGYEPATESFSGTNMYNIIGLILIVVSLLMMITFYYIINHPRSKWWHWVIALAINSVLGLFIAYGIVSSKYTNGYIPQDLMYQLDENGNVVTQHIYLLDCWGFGFGSAIVAALFFIAFTFMFKWWSSGAKHVPFF